MFNKKVDPVKHSAQVLAQCRAKDPYTCPYHRKYKLLQEAANSNNVALFLQMKADIEHTEKYNAIEKLERDQAKALKAGDEKTFQALRKQASKKKISAIAPVNQTGFRRARSYGGFASHIVDLAECSDNALCGTKWLDLGSDLTPEQVEAELEREHESFFYCRVCFEKFTGKPKPERG